MSVLDGLHFLRPAWLLLLALVPLLLWWWQRRRRAASAWRDAVDPHLLPHLLEAGPTGGGRTAPWLASLLLAVAALALAGPSWRQDAQPLWQPQAPLVIALDLSSSMLATDLAPSRLARARYKLADLLEQRRGGQSALVAYAGDAFVVAPLTDDAANVRAFLDALEPGIMPVDGQRADRAIARALELLDNAGFASGTILLVTDSADAAARDAAAAAAAQGAQVSVLGVGTARGAPVPTATGFADDGRGGVRMPRLDAASLRALADGGGGRYALLAGDRGDLVALGVLDAQGAVETAPETAEGRWRDDGIWLVLLLLPLALVGFRRGWLFLLPLALLLPMPRPALALDLERAFLRDDQRARAALDAGDAERARRLARDPALAAAAAYRAGDYAAAARGWAQLDGVDADYNRGNALASAEDYAAALEAYDAALARDPEHADARANRDAVQDWLDRQPPEPEQGGDEADDTQAAQDRGDDPQAPEGDGPSQDSAPGNQDAQAEREPGAESEDGQDAPPDEPDDAQAQQAAEAAARDAMTRALQERDEAPEPGEETPAQAEAREQQEQQQALEQWLRRIPDDPGGLLRRKFEIEYHRRQREGGQ